MTNTSPYGNRAGDGSRPVLASVIDSDFLGAHLESLLIRQPPTKGSSGSVNKSELSIFGAAADESPSRRPTSSKFTNTIRQMPVSPSSSRFSNSISPGDGIFGSINGAPSSIQQSRIGSNGYDYFSRASFGQAAGPSISSKNSSTISTSFGRRPSLRKAQSHSRSISQDHTDAMSDTSSAQVSSTKESVLLELALDRRASDGTNATGITSPMAESEALDWSLDKASISRLPAGGETADKDKELDAESEGFHSQSKPTTPYSPLPSPSRLEESGDQTTWERFKRGAVIEPPEAELNTSISASWLNGKSSYPKYTLSMTSERRKSGVSPGRDTVKAKALKGLSAPATKVTLVPCGDDGRTFRFT